MGGIKTINNIMSNKQICTLKLVGRVLLSIIFILAGFGKIGGFAGTAGYIASVGLPLPEVLTALTIVVELLGGLMLLVGLKTRLVATVLTVFTLLAAVIFHSNFGDQIQMTMFLKNLAMAGGLFYVIAGGAGRYSIDAKMEKKDSSAT